MNTRKSYLAHDYHKEEVTRSLLVKEKSGAGPKCWRSGRTALVS